MFLPASRISLSSLPFLVQKGRHRRLLSYRRAPEPSHKVAELLARYESSPPRPINLTQLLSFGSPVTENSVLASVSYALSELPRRLATRVRSLEALPFIVGTNPYVVKTLDAYRESFEWLATHTPVTNLEENTKFVEQLAALVQRHANDVPTMAKGFQECSRYMSPTQISDFLDGAIRNRISVRLIAEQHIAVSQALNYPNTPAAYVPVHLEYILTEVLKNSFRATVEHHYKQHWTTGSPVSLPPVTITISPRSRSVDSSGKVSTYLSLRIRDQGGGVLPSNMTRIFSYAFTTAGRGAEGSSEDGGGPYAAQHIGRSAAVSGEIETNLFGEIAGKGLQVGMGTIAGLGYGLPMSRLYARYFGGSLDFFSLEGWGSDVFLKLRCLDEAGDSKI
ncbi:hypothetical protein NLJ89_g278 [Agrocybe chaxingu]|uniref:Protein-serine/threonine kinase n=1 Tax=Agrocybe chaxingu TaxID=84603 RepID=A0A9W8TG75_9AGAR|nr:hypothetical protein NLJ89_g278 [Agrocybe chaxingu]